MESKVLVSKDNEYKRIDSSELPTYTELMGYHKVSAVYGASINGEYLRFLVGDEIYSYLASKGFKNMNLMATHNKTGHQYFIKDVAIGCNNGDEESLNIVYENDFGVIFVREVTEFFTKFTLCE